MFQPETEDMLPRMAPKPSSDVFSGSNEAIMRPQVPEVSILFGQQEDDYQPQVFKSSLQHQNKNFPPKSYAAWKKQMLPKVTFSAHTNIADSQIPENNQIMSGYNCLTTNMNPIQLHTSPLITVGSNANMFAIRNDEAESASALTYRRRLENYQPIQNFTILPSQSPMGTLQHKQDQLPNAKPEEILTICASTQTNACMESASNLPIQAEVLSNLATKHNIENIYQVLDELRADQQRILNLLETVAFSQYSQMTKERDCRDVGVQADLPDITNNPVNINADNDFFQHHQPAPKNKFIEHLKPYNLHRPRKSVPSAQSTAYRSNWPRNKNTPAHYQEFSKPTNIMNKSASDTSIVMNELALKYLPNEKLAELLDELNMDCPVVSSEGDELTAVNIVNFDNLEKSPTDMSNASYRYLKKYRLLPETHPESGKNSGQETVQNNIENQTPQYNSPQCNVQNSPINQRQTPSNKCSPFAADRLPLPAIARATPPTLPSTASPHIVDLDNIKQHPKFL